MAGKITRLRLTWQMARHILREAERGGQVVVIPARLRGQFGLAIWLRSVEVAAEKWEQRMAEISLPQWQAAARRLSGHRPDDRQEGE